MPRQRDHITWCWLCVAHAWPGRPLCGAHPPPRTALLPSHHQGPTSQEVVRRLPFPYRRGCGTQEGPGHISYQPAAQTAAACIACCVSWRVAPGAAHKACAYVFQATHCHHRLSGRVVVAVRLRRTHPQPPRPQKCTLRVTVHLHLHSASGTPGAGRIRQVLHGRIPTHRRRCMPGAGARPPLLQPAPSACP